MKLHVQVLEGQDLLRDPSERCKSRKVRRRKLSLDSSSTVADAESKKSAMDTVRKLASKIKSPLSGGDRKRLESSLATVEDSGKPFVWLRLRDREEKTSVGADRCKCIWNESFVFDVTGLWGHGEEGDELTLEIQVRDSMQGLNYGNVSIPLNRLSSSTRIKQWYQLSRPDVEDKDEVESGSFRRIASTSHAGNEDPCGVLLLSLCFEETKSAPEKTDTMKTKQRRISNAKSPTSPNASSRLRALPHRLADYVVMAVQKTPSFDPVLSDRIPELNHEDLPLPVKIEWFIFAFENKHSDEVDWGNENRAFINGIRADFFTFVHAPRGVPLYGYCLMYDSVVSETSPSSDSNRSDRHMSPRSCLCIVSRLNNGDMFRECLLEMFADLTAGEKTEEMRQESFRALARRLVYRVPMPLPGVLRVEFNLNEGSSGRFSCSLPRLGDLPSLTFANGLDFLIEKVGVGLLIELWGALLLEYKVIMHARQEWMLSAASETLMSLLYPFRWHHTYVSTLPAQLLECVEAPLPFIVGIHSDLVSEIPDVDLVEVILVDLDRGIVRKGASVSIEPVPAGEARRLARMVYRALDINPAAFDDPDCEKFGLSWSPDEESAAAQAQSSLPMSPEKARNIQLCFLECICQMLQGYRECLFFLNESMPVFNTPKFLERRGQDALFFSRFLETQAFESFKETQGSKWLRIFHTYYLKVKMRFRNRDQYLALNAQKRHSRERRKAAQSDPDEEDFDSIERNRQRSNNHLTIQRIEGRNENVWSARDRRRGKRDTAGLDVLDIEADCNDSDSEIDFDGSLSPAPPSVPTLNCCLGAVDAVSPVSPPPESPTSLPSSPTSPSDETQPEETQSTRPAPLGLSIVPDMRIPRNGNRNIPLRHQKEYDLEKISSRCNVPFDKLRIGLQDLKTMLGTQNYRENDRNELESDEDEDSGELHDVQEVHSDSGRQAEESDGGLQGETDAFDSEMPASPSGRPKTGRQRRKSSIAKTIATFDALNMQNNSRDRKVELALQDCITKIFLNKAVESDLERECSEALHLSKHARDLFVLILYQPHHRSTFSYGSKGRGLRAEAFSSLVFLCEELLKACAKKSDYSNARQMLELSHSYYLDRSSPTPSPSGMQQVGGSSLYQSVLTGNALPGRATLEQRRRSFAEAKQIAIPVSPEDYLEAHLRGLPIWQSILFWEDAFAEVISMEYRKRSRTLSAASENESSFDFSQQTTDGAATSSASSSSSESASSTKRRMTAPPSQIQLGLESTSAQTPRTTKKANKDFQDVLFELASGMVYQMIRVGASQDKAKALVSRIVTQHGLAPEHEDTLGTLIANVSKAVDITTA